MDYIGSLTSSLNTGMGSTAKVANMLCLHGYVLLGTVLKL